ncbi:MAG: DUF951 domain-containing protein [Bacillota bacterium]|nr:DUF951 domain-containing protein [Bacillota bacterium]MDW7676549.1 DUF951 domain-containing protein [Bacillota bacterium]
MPMALNVGDRVTLKKAHPCGSKQFTILRTGADFRIKCEGCGHDIWIARPNLEKRIRKVEPGPRSQENGS